MKELQYYENIANGHYSKVERYLRILGNHVQQQLDMRGQTYFEHIKNVRSGRSRPGPHNPQTVTFRHVRKSDVPSLARSYTLRRHYEPYAIVDETESLNDLPKRRKLNP